MDSEITSAALQRLLGINKSILSDLVAREIVKPGRKRGSYMLGARSRATASTCASKHAGVPKRCP
jgi:hypothetical protein